MKEWITLEICYKINNLMEKRLRPGNLLGDDDPVHKYICFFRKLIWQLGKFL